MDINPEVKAGETPVTPSTPAPRRPIRQGVWMLALVALLGGGYWQQDALMSLVGFSGPKAAADSKGRGGRGGGRTGSTAVRFVLAEKISIQRSVDLSGTLAAIDQARVSAEATGIVKELRFELGQEVTAGQVLIELDTRELELARTRAESALRQIEAQLGIRSAQPGGPAVIPPDEQIAAVRTASATRDDAAAQDARAQELSGRGLISRADRDTVHTRLKVAEAALQSAIENVAALKATLEDRRAASALAQKKIGDATIRAPMSGSISERLVSRGEFVRENAQVATIVLTNPLKLRTAVQERYANLIRPDLKLQFRVESFPGRSFEGKIANISPSIDQESRTFPVEALVDNAQKVLKPGAFATGSIFTHFDSGIVAVPEEAVSILAGVSSVYIVDDGAVRQQSVTLGAHQGRIYEVLEGLKGGETLAASNLSQLVTGDRVTEAPAEPAPDGAGAEAPKVAAPRGGNATDKPADKPAGRGSSVSGDGRGARK